MHSRSLVSDLNAFNDVPLGAILDELSKDFLEIEQIQRLVKHYGENEIKCERKELLFVLRTVHELAFKMCIECMMKHSLIPKDEGEKVLESIIPRLEQAVDVLNMGSLEEEKSEQISTIDEFQRKNIVSRLEDYAENLLQQQLFRMDNKSEEQGFLYSDEAGEKGNKERNWFSIRVDYPNIYVDQLKELIFPQSYVVCFSSANDNSAMWGNYADNHKGVCLIYESDELMIRHSKVTVDTGDSFTRLNDYSKLEVTPIEYGGEMVHRNFFETLGQLSCPQICTWLSGPSGRSKIIDYYSKDKDLWRESYWKADKARRFRKLDSWKHESEYRASITNVFGIYDDPAKRNLEFSPDALKGVIFGIKTSEYDKRRIIDAVPSECDWLNKDKFNFYQAFYDDDTGKIEIIRQIMTFGR